MRVKKRKSLVLILISIVLVLFVLMTTRGLFGTPESIVNQSKAIETTINFIRLLDGLNKGSGLKVEEFVDHESAINFLVNQGFIDPSEIYDGWGREILLNFDNGQLIEIRSAGADGVHSTSDDFIWVSEDIEKVMSKTENPADYPTPLSP